MAKIVYITFYSDSLEGSRLVQLANHVCRLYDIMREDDKLFKKFERELDKPALYILLNRKSKKAYIGQTDCFIQRISQHISKKEFWDEVLVFVASDDSINATEVQYLEAKAYDVANNAHKFDLSENSQIPRPHKISQLAEYNAQGFFGAVHDLAKIVGCNIFEKQEDNKQRAKVDVIVEDNLAKDEYDLKGRGVKLLLNGRGPFTKGQFVLEVIREYINRNPSTTIQMLKEEFPDDYLKNWKAWPLIETDIEKAKNIVSDGKRSRLRHFVEEDCVLVSPADKKKFVVSSQWDYINLPGILTKIEEFGWSYKIIKG